MNEQTWLQYLEMISGGGHLVINPLLVIADQQ